ncbi:MAG: hypothetical protein K9H16_13390 [Bacteroidales bacterium]|nr:hypothetical protein [Bacteroidales bacterium]
MKRLKLIFLGIFAIALIISSCKKENDAPASGETNTQATEYDALAENIFNDVGDISDEAWELSSTNYKSTEADTIFFGDCVTVLLDTVATPHEMVIDFGEENCLCRDGRYRRGKIINTFSGRYRQPGTVITHGFDEYFVNDNKVEGSRVLTNMGYNEDDNMYFTIEIEALITLAEQETTISWNASKVREWVEGSDTPRFRRDDVYLITGSASGLRPSGSGWTREIIIPLRRELNCRFLVSGSIEIIPDDQPLRLLDYGSGECDNEATITVNGRTITIFLH